ncbi:MAG: hypothetical protein WCR85_00155 [Sphaerochaeta sp.]
MGEMNSGGAPRIKSIVTYLTTLASTVLDGLLRVNLRSSDGAEAGTEANPLHMAINPSNPCSANVTQIAGTAASINIGDADAGTLRVVNATNDVNLSAIKNAVEGANADIALIKPDVVTLKGDVTQIRENQGKHTTPIVTPSTGSGAIAASYAPAATFWLDNVTIHLSAVPTTAEVLKVALDVAEGEAYDTVLFSIDPSTDGGSDIVYIPEQPILCTSGDAVAVTYANTDAVTYGVRIVTRFV